MVLKYFIHTYTHIQVILSGTSFEIRDSRRKVVVGVVEKEKENIYIDLRSEI